MKRLKEIREKLGYSQDKIAVLLNKTQGGYSHIENGRVKLDEESIILLSNFFNVSTDYLLGLTDEKTPPKITKEAEMLKDITPEQMQTIKIILQIPSSEIGEIRGYAGAVLNRIKKPFEEV